MIKTTLKNKVFLVKSIENTNGLSLKECLGLTKKEVQESFLNYLEDLNVNFQKYTEYCFLYNDRSGNENLPFTFTISKLDEKRKYSIEVSIDETLIDSYLVTKFITIYKSWLVNLSKHIKEIVTNINILPSDVRHHLFEEFNNRDKIIIVFFELQISKPVGMFYM